MSIRDPNSINVSWAGPAPRKIVNPLPSRERVIIKDLRQINNDLPTEKPLAQKTAPKIAKPKDQDVKSLGVVDFTGKGMVKGIANTKNFRYRFDKQLKGVLGKTGQRSAVMKNFTDRMSSSGKMSVRDAKHAIWASQDAGHITQGQARHLMGRLGI